MHACLEQLLTQLVSIGLSMRTECCIQEELFAHPVSFSDHDPNASTDVVLAMGGMSIRKAPQHSRQYGPRSKSLGTQSADSGDADSMFAWLSKLLPAL